MTQTEINGLARALGMGPRQCAQVWRYFCPTCGSIDTNAEVEQDTGGINCWCNDCGDGWEGPMDPNCTLPDPEGDEPAVMLWDGALLRALASVCKAHLALCMQPSHYGDWYAQGVTGSGENDLRATHGAVSTAALLAAWKATR